uniref:Uncharacterized protein n=1 Tax=Anser brachyrhynchus TaxID=132585 RepID=A0A8B9BVM0_9AVES
MGNNDKIFILSTPVLLQVAQVSPQSLRMPPVCQHGTGSKWRGWHRSRTQ